MKMFRRLLTVVFCSALVSSCFDPPEYPDSPEISYKSVDFIKGGELPGGQLAADSIILVLNFKDGDGDVGVSSEETGPPFNDRWYYTKEKLKRDDYYIDDCTTYDHKCWFIRGELTEFDKYVDLHDKQTTPYDTLPAFAKPENCTNWEVVYYDNDDNDATPMIPLDTLYFETNPHYNNIFVDLQMKTGVSTDPTNPDSGFETFDEKQFFTYPNCGIRIFNGRIPVLSEDLSSETPLEGIIRYSIPSVSFQTIFGSKVLRLKVYIEDRALNKSNIVRTREFTLTE